jgi:antibiotic biosynthesis monooxygenase (ABM) superfamily enzyme
MSQPVALIATARLRPEDIDAFTAWQGRHEAMAASFPGFLSSDLIPPSEAGHDEWTLILNFQTAADLKVWQEAPERQTLIDEALPFFAAGHTGQALVGDTAAEAPVTGVTGMIFSRIKPGMADRYRQWAVRIQAAQAKYPGYRGMYLQPPATDRPDATWTTFVRYDTAAHLDAWMTSPERAAMLAEAEAYVDNVELVRLATSFPGWVPVDPATGMGPPDWKTALLVLLGLFPLVMLEIRFLNPVFSAWQWNSSFATFIANALSVAATSFITMPLCVRWFGWWLFPDAHPGGRPAWSGGLLLSALFAAEVAALWTLLP